MFFYFPFSMSLIVFLTCLELRESTHSNLHITLFSKKFLLNYKKILRENKKNIKKHIKFKNIM